MEERENETGNLYHNHIAVYRRESPRADRPHPCRNGSHLYRKGKENLEEPGKSHAAPNHRPHLDKGRGGSRHRLAEGVQRLSGFVPFGCQLCRTDIRLLSRDNPSHGKHGRVHRATQEKSGQCRGSSTLHEPEQDIPGTDIQLRGDCQ